MKIWIDTSFELEQKTGIGSYILTLISALDKAGYKYETVECKWNKKGIRAILQSIWQNTVLYAKTLKEKPDVIILPNFRAPFIKRKKTTYITVIYDLQMFEPGYMDKYHEILFQSAVKCAIKNSDKIITISEFTKNEILKRFKYKEENIKILYCETSIKKSGEEKIFFDKKISPKHYILSVSTTHKNKNLISLIHAFNKISPKYPDIKLVLTGRKGNAELKMSNSNIVYTGYVSDEELSALYSNAMLYCSPSLYEGFGIPNIEAQTLGTPVLCSNIDIYRETMQDSAEFCEPNAEGIAEKIEYLINNPERRDELIRLGQENIKRFNLEKIAEQLGEVLNS